MITAKKTNDGDWREGVEVHGLVDFPYAPKGATTGCACRIVVEDDWFEHNPYGFLAIVAGRLLDACEEYRRTADTHIGGPRDWMPVSGGCTYSQQPTRPPQARNNPEGDRLFVTYARIDGRFVFQGLLPWAEGHAPEPPPDPVYPKDSPALVQGPSEHYPSEYGGRIPKRVRLLQRICPDCAWIWTPKHELPKLDRQAGEEHDVYVNRHGAVSLILPGFDKLGVRPGEFEVIEWHEKSNAPVSD